MRVGNANLGLSVLALPDLLLVNGAGVTWKLGTSGLASRGSRGIRNGPPPAIEDEEPLSGHNVSTSAAEWLVEKGGINE
jgi:hypothetical protein